MSAEPAMKAAEGPNGLTKGSDAAKPADESAQKKPAAGPRKIQPPSVEERARRAKEIKQQRITRLARRIGLLVGLPTLLAAIYYTMIVTPQFESVSVFTIHSAEGGGAPSLSLFLGGLSGGSSTGRDGMLARKYILSRDMLASLPGDGRFVSHYRNPDVDILSRLRDDQSTEEIYEYYLEHVQVTHDPESGALELRVRAFSTEVAQELNTAILDSTERMVNRLAEDARQDSIQFTRQEVDAAERRLSAARLAILELQQTGDVFSPTHSAGAVLTVRSGLEAELARAQAELSALMSTMQRTAPQVVAQRQQVSALRGQVNRQTRRLIDDEGSGVSASIARFEPAMIEKEFAQQAYQSALASLELARIEADRQHRYLVRIAVPSAPDEYTHPSIVLGILSVFLLSFALMGVGSLLLAVLREHANV